MTARILIVEDDQQLAFVLREAMLRKEHQAEVVTGIAALLERIRGSSYDVILLDLKLTDGDGLDAIRPCRELAPDIPIIAMRSEEHTSELQSRPHLVCRLLL